jgi:hypothetical protein
MVISRRCQAKCRIYRWEELMITIRRNLAVAVGAAALAASTLAATPALAAPAPAGHAGQPAHAAAPAGNHVLLRALRALGLRAVVHHSYVGATGRADAVSVACTVLGTDLRFGSVAFFTGQDETGSGAVVFTGDNEAPDTFFGLTGASAASMQNCTNQTWAISNPGATKVAAATRARTAADITPTTGVFTDPAPGQANPFTATPDAVPSWDLTG